MKTLHRLLTLSLSLGAAAAAFAQTSDAPRGPRPGHRPPPHPLIRALDANRDGEITAGEIASAPSSLRTLDTDGDGALSFAELHPAPPAGAPAPPAPGNRAGRPRPVDPVMLALDANADGALSSAEIAHAAASLAALDANADGKLTRDELRPAGGPPHDGPPPSGSN